MTRLVKQGLVRAVRGQKGGFELMQAPEKLTLIDVLEALEGPLAITESMPPDSPVTEYASRAEAMLRQMLNVPLAEVLVRYEDRAMMFHI